MEPISTSRIPVRNYVRIGLLALLGVMLIMLCSIATVGFAVAGFGFASGIFLMFAALSAAGLILSLVFSVRVLWPMIRYYAKAENIAS